MSKPSGERVGRPQFVGCATPVSQQALNVLHAGTERSAGLLEPSSCKKGAESLGGGIDCIAVGGNPPICQVQGGQRLFCTVEQYGKDGCASQSWVSDVPINAGTVDLPDACQCLLGCHLRHMQISDVRAHTVRLDVISSLNRY